LWTAKDPERSYFFPLNTMFLVKGITGISAAQALLGYARHSDEVRVPSQKTKRGSGGGLAPIAVLAGGALVHGSIVIALWYFGQTAASAAWVIGISLLMLWGSVRQILEHRMDDARPNVDYAKVDQGACTRIFGESLVARLLGASGFNRHLIHHWEPQVPYTRLPELERFLADTQMRPILDRRRTTYVAMLRQMFTAG
jgi:fatty acid desaturase